MLPFPKRPDYDDSDETEAREEAVSGRQDSASDDEATRLMPAKDLGGFPTPLPAPPRFDRSPPCAAPAPRSRPFVRRKVTVRSSEVAAHGSATPNGFDPEATKTGTPVPAAPLSSPPEPAPLPVASSGSFPAEPGPTFITARPHADGASRSWAAAFFASAGLCVGLIAALIVRGSGASQAGPTEQPAAATSASVVAAPRAADPTPAAPVAETPKVVVPPVPEPPAENVVPAAATPAPKTQPKVSWSPPSAPRSPKAAPKSTENQPTAAAPKSAKPSRGAKPGAGASDEEVKAAADALAKAQLENAL